MSLYNYSIILILELNIQEYFRQKKNLYNLIINYIEDENQEEEDQELFNVLDDQQFYQNKEDIGEILYIISNISENHHRSSDFFDKINEIIHYCENSIKQTFSNQEIFDFFKNNKLMILHLLQEKIIIFEESMIDMSKKDFIYYFNKEYQQFSNKQLFKINFQEIDNFEESRQNGENTSYICEIIRKDAIDDFVVYVNRTNYSLSSRIKPSFFETNALLIDNEDTTLIEYAAFFGSIQIFQYLRLNGVTLSPSLWIYAIHSKNPELIHLLEENNVIPEDESYEECLEEAIKCHHNDIANYINDNLLTNLNLTDENWIMKKKVLYFSRYKKPESKSFYIKEYEQNINAYSFHYHNYEFMQDDFKNKFIFHYLCQYNYISLVKLFTKEIDIDINSTISDKIIQNNFINDIQKQIILNKILSIYFLYNNFKNRCYKCESLSKISLPSSLKSIDTSAFKGCTALSQIDIPSSVTNISQSAFQDCKSLKQITIPSSVTKITRLTFSGCNSLEKVTIPSSVTQIDPESFLLCVALKEVSIPSVTIIFSCAFKNCSSLEKISYSDKLTFLGEEVFNGCSSLKEIEIPSSIDEIQSRMFQSCISLVNIKINSLLKKIGGHAFSQCIALTQITIPPSVVLIDTNAFSYCSSLEKITIPPSVTKIKDGAFQCCKNLKEINLPPNIDVIDSYLFYGCSSLTRISIPQSVITIDSNSFAKCTSLKQISIPNSVKSIKYCAFTECSQLSKISLQTGLNYIGDYAFSNCVSLKQIETPPSLTYLGKRCFDNCISLKKISIKPEFVSQLDQAGIGVGVKVVTDQSNCLIF